MFTYNLNYKIVDSRSAKRLQNKKSKPSHNTEVDYDCWIQEEKYLSYMG